MFSSLLSQKNTVEIEVVLADLVVEVRIKQQVLQQIQGMYLCQLFFTSCCQHDPHLCCLLSGLC
jgi:hypothetical protein